MMIKKITLVSLILFIITSGVIFIGNLFSNRKQIEVSNANPYSIQDINSPAINIDKLSFNSNNNTKDTFTVDKVAKHNSKNDCYLIINNKVYNVSSYISYHPAGSKIIISHCGKEVTGIFARIHSNRAWDLLKRYKIGTIITNKMDTTPKVLTVISEALKKANPNAKIIKVSPKMNFYVAKIIYDGKLYEVHINSQGKIFKEEIEDDESNWSLWEDDNDDK